MTDSLGAAALSPTPVADRAVRFLQAGGTVALAAESGIVPGMVDGVLARARADSGFAALVDAAARTVVATKFLAGLVTCPGQTGPIEQHHAALGGASGFLGAPVGAQRPVAGGAVQDYQGGSIYWSPSTGAHEVHGAVRDHYRALGGPEGVLGFPVTDESGTADGAGRSNDFDGGGGASVVWSPATGVWSVHGAVRQRWLALGGTRGVLGYPVTDESGAVDGVGRFNHFSRNGSVFWTPSTGAHEVHGAIRAHWAALGWERGPVGYPATDELGTADGVGRFNQFTGSGGASIYWTPDTGARAVWGALRDRWAAQGSERGPLGYPVSDPHPVPGGTAEDFQHGTLRV
jgi:uncharacterized protein with LGFP repeats